MATIPTRDANRTAEDPARTFGAPDGPGGRTTLLTSTSESGGASLRIYSPRLARYGV